MRFGSSMLVVGAGAAFGLSAFMACGGGTFHAGGASDAGATATKDASTLCASCVSSATCGGTSATCAQVGGDSYCVQPCPNGDECAEGSVCDAVTTVSGDKVNACLSLTDICGTGQGAPAQVPDAGCASIFAPTADAGCGQCTPSADAGRYCQANGCRHGLYCNMATVTCEQAPAACGGNATIFDGGAPVEGTVSGDGGALSRLYFAVVGDTRPPNEDETSAYPTQIIDTIFGDVAALKPMPSFVVSTGDYMFASTNGTQQEAQVELYLAARSKYPGLQFPAMGNHECTGATASNCGTGNVDGVTTNYTTFMTKLLGPIGQTSPYYAVNLVSSGGSPDGSDGSWTAKLVFVAANAWSDAQGTWLDQTLAVPTTYTFVVRHEPADTTTTPGVTPSEAIIAKHPYTLEIVGHSHEYGHPLPKEVLIGNGGAPLSGSGNYGFGIFAQRTDGAIVVDMIDYESGLADGTFHFAVKPDGSPATP